MPIFRNDRSFYRLLKRDVNRDSGYLGGGLLLGGPFHLYLLLFELKDRGLRVRLACMGAIDMRCECLRPAPRPGAGCEIQLGHIRGGFTQRLVMSVSELLSGLNLDYHFEVDLRERLDCPEDAEEAVGLLQGQLRGELSDQERVSLLGQLGSLQRMKGQLAEAEGCLKEAVSLCEREPELLALLPANLIRLGHVHHWKEEYELAHSLFDQCLLLVGSGQRFSQYLDFVYQHKGKCYFDQKQYMPALDCFVKAMDLRGNKQKVGLLDSTLFAIEQTNKRWLPQLSPVEVRAILDEEGLPEFVRETIGKKHGEELAAGRWNCINAALGFHLGFNAGLVRPQTPDALLSFLMEQTHQLRAGSDFAKGDLVVFWKRNGGAWKNRSIQIKEMDPDSQDFPYGLIFDHVAVRVTPEVVFHKPNPSENSSYRFDYLQTASYPSCLGEGYEMTFHRVS